MPSSRYSASGSSSGSGNVSALSTPLDTGNVSSLMTDRQQSSQSNSLINRLRYRDTAFQEAGGLFGPRTRAGSEIAPTDTTRTFFSKQLKEKITGRT